MWGLVEQSTRPYIRAEVNRAKQLCARAATPNSDLVSPWSNRRSTRQGFLTQALPGHWSDEEDTILLGSWRQVSCGWNLVL